MMKDITFGQYYPGKSFLHHMDPRAKLVLTILFIVGIFFIKSFVAFALVGVVLVGLIFLSRVRFLSVLKSLKAILFLVLFTTILNVLFYSGGNILAQWWIFRITDEALIVSAMLALRLIFLVAGTTLLTLTTTPVALTDGIESLLTPLKFIKFPVHEFALIMSITLRFIPTLSEETDRIMSAQKARGADFESGNIFKRAKAMIPILIPLLVGAFRRAEELAYAMEARCYMGSKGRTKMKKLRFGYRDIVATLFIVALFVLILVDCYILPFAVM